MNMRTRRGTAVQEVVRVGRRVLPRAGILGCEIRRAEPQARPPRTRLAALLDFFSCFMGVCSANNLAGERRVLVLRTTDGTIEVGERELGRPLEEFVDELNNQR